MDVWIARDEDGDLSIYFGEPEWSQFAWFPIYPGSGYRRIDPALFPEVKPKECQRATLAIADPKPVGVLF